MKTRKQENKETKKPKTYTHIINCNTSNHNRTIYTIYKILFNLLEHSYYRAIMFMYDYLDNH